ncbi:MAG TPA: class I SAM-dependent methyltransferase [Vicinamibacterales bacterium]|nr:class I SAM-dependent methyltransferase [Vicinamibacterales bacterium]
MIAAKHDWERAEVERSRYEASHAAASLIADEQQVSRYLDPPADSVFPLESAYGLLGDVRGLTVLDFGCGSGENSLLLARRGAHVIGVDISEHLIALARQRLAVNGLPGAARFIVGSAHDLPLAGGSVDMVVGIAILHHLDLQQASREVFRVLKDGGRAIFQEPVRDSKLLKAVRRLIPYRAPDVSPFERPLTSSELRQFASSFQTESLRAFLLPFVSVALLLSPLRRYIGKLYRIDRAMLTHVPALARLAAVRVIALSKRAAVA